MTFNKGEIGEGNPEAPPFFALNPVESKVKSLEKIEEKEEYDQRKGSGANSNELRRQAESDQSSSSEESKEDDDAGTGNFSQIERAKATESD